MIHYHDHFEDDRSEDEAEQIKELKELLDEMAAELSEPETKQASLNRDYQEDRFIPVTKESQQFIDWQYLSVRSN